MGVVFLLWRDKLLFFALLGLFGASSTYLRVLIRAVLEGGTFEWSYYSGPGLDAKPALTSGAGLLGHTDHLLISAGVVLWLLCVGMRGAGRSFQAALFGWTSIQFGVAVWLSAAFGRELTVSMETLGVIEAPAAWFSLPPLAASWILSLALLVRGPRTPAAPAPWTRLNTVLLGAGALLLLGAALALNLGVQHGPGDLLGVALIYLGLIPALLGLAPWAGRRGATG